MAFVRKVKNGKTNMSQRNACMGIHPDASVIRAAMMQRIGHCRNDGLQIIVPVLGRGIKKTGYSAHS
jgi:hypothetical protein